MKPLKFLKNSAGIGLLEIMVAIGLTGALSLTIARLMQNSTEEAKVIEAKSTTTSFKAQLEGILGNATACQNTFSSLTVANLNSLNASPANSVSISAIKNKVPTNIFLLAGPNPSIFPLTITTMVITNYSFANTSADLVVQTSFKKSKDVTMTPKPVTVKLNFLVSNPGLGTAALTSCVSLSAGGDSGQWQDMTGGAMGIFYNMGSVLIGTGTANTGLTTPSFSMGTSNTVTGRNSSGLGVNNTVSGTAAAFAAGTNNTANGAYGATALGYQNTATGSAHPIAMGYFSQATGDASFAIQGGQATETNSFAGGGGSVASGMSSFAFGFNSSANNTAAGHGSFALGDSNSVTGTGQWAFALGSQNTVSGQSAYAFGETNSISGASSFALGTSNAVSGAHAFAQGLQNYVSGRYGHAAGYLNTVSAEAGSTFGKGNIASGINSHAVGEANLASGLSSSAFGYYNTASGPYSFVAGWNSTASLDYAIALGYQSTASGNNSFAASSGIASGTSAVALGSGSEATFSNALAIGGDAKAIGAVGVGQQAGAYGRYSVAIGRQAITGTSGTQDSVVNGQHATAIGYRANATWNGSMVLAGQLAAGIKTPSASGEGKLTMYFPGGVELCNMLSGNSTGTCIAPGVQWLAGASSWVIISDKNEKKNFEEIDGKYVLDSISQLDLTTWQYKGQIASDKKRHIGPMAQDFNRFFAKKYSFYSSDKMIAEGDVSGIMLVGIKELEKRTRDLASENTKLKKENALLKEAVCEVNPNAKVCRLK